MEKDSAKMDELLKNVRERYKQVDSLMVSTKEMEKAVSLNDMESLDIVLDMRRRSMERIDQLNKDIADVVGRLDPPRQDRIKEILYRDGKPAGSDDPLETDIFDMNQSTKLLIGRVVDLDKAVNQRFQKESVANVTGAAGGGPDEKGKLDMKG